MFVRMLLLFRVCVAALCFCTIVCASEVRADSRTDFLVRMLGTSSQFRVRAQAALALGAAEDPAVVPALTKALRRDGHPAVRAASASALERLGAPSSAAALKLALRDNDKTVRAAAKRALDEVERGLAKATPKPAAVAPSTPFPSAAREALFYVGVGLPGSQVSTLSAGLLRNLREHLAREVVQIAGVRLAPENESRSAAERELRAQKMTGYFIDSSVTSLETKPDGSIRAQVSVVVGTYPGRDMRAMLSGAATVSGGGSGESTRLEAMRAAYTGALRRLPQAMQAGLARAQ